MPFSSRAIAAAFIVLAAATGPALAQEGVELEIFEPLPGDQGWTGHPGDAAPFTQTRENGRLVGEFTIPDDPIIGIARAGVGDFGYFPEIDNGSIHDEMTDWELEVMK